jgi:xanthine dehydrogenase accessory factor
MAGRAILPATMQPPVGIIRSGGELGTGVAHALYRAGLRLLVVDRPVPTALRLGVAFAAAAYQERVVVGGVTAVLCRSNADVALAWERAELPLWTGAEAELELEPAFVVDARMRRLTERSTERSHAPVVIGIGPGFEVGVDVHYVVESQRGPSLGRVITRGQAARHTGVPGEVAGVREERILRAPTAGTLVRRLELGDYVEAGVVVATVEGQPVSARIAGMVRGLKLTGVPVGAGHKVGDVDPRRDRALLTTMTDKARAVGQGVLDALEIAGLLRKSDHRSIDDPSST